MRATENQISKVKLKFLKNSEEKLKKIKMRQGLILKVQDRERAQHVKSLGSTKNCENQ